MSASGSKKKGAAVSRPRSDNAAPPARKAVKPRKPAASSAGQPLRAPTFREDVLSSLEARMREVIQQGLERMTREQLQRAVAAPSPAATVFEVLSASPEVGLERDTATTRALARGAVAKQEMITAAGGCLSSSEVAALLGVSVSAVNQRRARSAILAVPLSGGEWGFPARQFSAHEVRGGVAEVVQAAGDLSPWVLLGLLLEGGRRPGGIPLLERLGDPDVRADLLARVRSYGEQGGA
jgi:hypothetical protein